MMCIIIIHDVYYLIPWIHWYEKFIDFGLLKLCWQSYMYGSLVMIMLEACIVQNWF